MATLRCDFLYVETNCTIQKTIFDTTDPNIIKTSVDLLLIRNYFVLIFLFYYQKRQVEMPAKYNKTF